MAEDDKPKPSFKDLTRSFSQIPRAVRLVLSADGKSAIGIVLFSFVGALLPLAIAYVGKLIVDGVLLAAETGTAEHKEHALVLVAVELGLMLATALLSRTTGLLRALLGTKLGYLINLRILEKAQTLDLVHFETPAIYDKLQNARREASSRPLNAFTNAVDIVSSIVTLLSYGAVLATFSLALLVVLVVATVPTFLVEAKFSGEAFRLFTWRAPEGRRMRYLEILLTRDTHAKEVKLFALGELLLSRYRALYEKFFGEERSLAVRRSLWGFLLGTFSTLCLYGSYAWIVLATVEGRLTLGDMTLYISVFRQGQGSLRNILRALGTTYEDNMFLSNLFGFLELPTGQPIPPSETRAAPVEGERGFVLENVSFRYPGTKRWVLEKLDLVIGPEEKLAIVGANGAGKTTLIKLLCGLYRPTEGSIRLDGVPLDQIPAETLHRRFGVVLQDFGRYQFTAQENVGLGQPDHLEDLERIELAAEKGGATAVIDGLPERWNTQLGRWFDGGVDLSMGNWQKIAVSRAFMRDADILVLDEPTASLDAEAEHALFLRFRDLTERKMALLISHRFSTVRMADRIAVLAKGRIEEVGTHDALMAEDRRYARMFNLQAAGYLDLGG
ncbi:MAG: ABC transporter ATP-binding protein [Deltaproteobacteria bacterium]|jgi:ATP-binding cassette subfamily B protein